ncbi:Sucrose synthase [Hibiscus syriacus]|uniref:Sucrose synthase n=1 Tax=Hibiscus syriacus TaxID=106335 RepID=A0A6A2WMY7_HIBSY|nr:Sucrose synthase [Hibiscus syriacus]
MDRLSKCNTNYVPLTPLMFLKRANNAYTNRTSIIYENSCFTWRQTYERCCRLASSLRSLNICKNQVVFVLAPNIPAMYEMHFVVPMAGVVLNNINTRLDAKSIATILRHSEAKVFFVDYQYVQLASEALRMLMGEQGQSSNMPVVIVIDDLDSPTGVRLGELEYEELIHNGNPHQEPHQNQTGCLQPSRSVSEHFKLDFKGVMTRGGTNVCIRDTSACDMYRSIATLKVTHMCCAPIMFNILLEAKPEEFREISSPVQVLTGGAPPPATLLEKMEHLGFHITYAYGMTEATDPTLVCEWQAKWNHLSNERKAKLKAQQGISV